MQEVKYKINDWAMDDRPREKLLKKSPAALSDSELLAILLREGTPEMDCLQLAKELLKLGKNDLSSLGKLSIKEMTAIRGMGMAKAITIQAALELGRRRQASLALDKPVVKGSRDIAHY